MRVSRIAAALLLLAAPARAASVQAQFNVTATVLNNCAVSASDLAFGNYSANTASPLAASTTVQVTCTTNLAYTVALDGGSTSGLVGARAMTDGATHNLTYGLYTSGAHSSIWGDGTGSTVTVAGSGSGSAQNLTVYGLVGAGQYVPAGSYSDRITVTVSY